MGLDESDEQRLAREALFDALLLDIEVISVRCRERLQEELRRYAPMSAGLLDLDVRLEIERVLRAARAGRDLVNESDLIELAAVGEQRAHQGVPIEEMLRAWRIGVQVTIAYAQELAARLGISDTSTLEFVQSTLAWADVAMLTVAAGHRGVELQIARIDQELRAAFVRRVLFGTLTPAEIPGHTGSHGLDPQRLYVAIRARAADSESRARLGRSIGLHENATNKHPLSTLIDGDLAGFLREPPAAAVDGVVGVGPPRPLNQLAESFRIATRALDTAAGFDMTGVHHLDQLGLRVAVAADRDVGAALQAKYVDPVLEGGGGLELLECLRGYFACGMKVQTAAEKLFVHQNTIRYRLARFEELVGASLRDPAVAFDVWWALEWWTFHDPREVAL